MRAAHPLPMRRRFRVRELRFLLPLSALLLAFGLSGCAGRDRAQTVTPQQRSLVVVSVNDVYRMAGVDGGARGGLARLRTLRRELEAGFPDLILLHAGDFLFPSLLSREFDGAQMVDVMNLLDGDPEGFDDRFFVTFGNHEFDQRRLEHAADLQSRIDESDFVWLDSDLHWKNDAEGAPLIGGENLRRSVLRESGGVRVGIFSLSTPMAFPEYVESFDDPEETARRTCRELREAGAEVVVALTHQSLDDDVHLLEALGDEGPDVVFGGHEHERQAREVGGRWIYKADADVLSANVARIVVGPSGGVRVEQRWEDLGPVAPEPDPAIESRIGEWVRRFDHRYCVEERSLGEDCLEEVLGRTSVELVAEELRVRRYETNFGDWITDQMRKAFAEQGAQIAFVNAGVLRLNENLPAGGEITQRHIATTLAYPAPMRLIEIDGRTLQQVTDRAVEVWSGNGWWLQISGFAFRHDPETQSTSDLTLLGPDGPRPIAPDEILRAAVISFLVDPALGQDGFTMLGPDQVVAEGPDLKDAVIAGLRGAGAAGIQPRIEGRICEPDAEPCLAVEASSP